MRTLAAAVLNQNTTLPLDAQMRRLALESGFTANVADLFRNTIPNLVEHLVGGYKDLLGSSDLSAPVREMHADFRRLETKLPHAVYLNYTSTVVSVPEGFEGSLHDYVVFLHSVSEEMFREALQTIGEYNGVLSTFISNKDAKTSLKDHSDLFRRVEKRREEITARVKEFFPGTQVTPKKRLGQVVSRFAELEQIVAMVDKLDRDRKDHSLKEFAAAVHKSCDLLAIVVKQTTSEGVDNVSGNAAMNISQGAFELGKYVELVALYRNMVDQAVATSAKLVKQLSEIL